MTSTIFFERRLVRVPLFALVALAASCGTAEAEKLYTNLPGDIPMPDPLPDVSPQVMGQIGIAPTPRNFPNHTDKDVRDMVSECSRLGSVGVLIYQWGDPNMQVVSKTMIASMRKAGLIPVVGLSPTTLTHQRQKLDVPSHLRGGFFSKPSFSKADVREAFVAECERLAGFNLPYLCLATEINFLALKRIQEYLHFVEAYKEAYRAVKKISPDTKVFVSFAYDFIRVVDNKEPGRVQEHAKVIDVFRPELDLVGITSYPSEFYDDPADMPRNYYTHLRRYLKPGEQVLVMEIGWPSSGKGSAVEQSRFVERLPVLMADISPVMTAWSLLHDVKISAFDDNLASTGLLTSDGQSKASFESFVKMRQQAD